MTASHLRDLWSLDPTLAFLNHGSYGATPTVVLEAQGELRRALERNPVDFFARRFPKALALAREAVAAFVGADPAGFVFVPNASTGIATVLANATLGPGDELLTTDHAYPACRNALERAASQAGARVVVARLPFPGATDDGIVDAVLAAVTPRTRLAVLDHITSPTALVLPIERLVGELRVRGIDTLVDGAHAPGAIDLDVGRIGAAYYTGNGHKWTCAPKGAAFLHVRDDRRERLRPLVTSHGYARPLEPGETRFRAEHDWVGTMDPTAYLAWPIAIDVVGAMLEGGWAAVRARNHEAALAARRLLCERLGVAPAAPDAMIACMAAVELPDGPAQALGDALYRDHRIEVPIVPWPAAPRRLLRVSTHLHTRTEDVLRLVDALPGALRAAS
ncbi:MAG: aminotransferase class V-fold PLP-dependent enzyme [Deltaproteobacteria bacterium]|nr:aminotransferase class V-fold PLP-dependent enzyme [Deltaproteobacteria bacterium]